MSCQALSTPENATNTQIRSIKGYIQISKLILMAVCTVLVLSILIDRSPL